MTANRSARFLLIWNPVAVVFSEGRITARGRHCWGVWFVSGENPVKIILPENCCSMMLRKNYKHLLNVDLPWNWCDLPEATQVECPAKPITAELVTKVIGRFILGKATVLSVNITKMLLPAGEAAS